MGLQDAFDRFMTDKNSEVFYEAVNLSTKASWTGSGYSVELFPNGTYRVLRNHNIGNLYDSPGLILGVPPLSQDNWDDENPGIRYYDDAEDEMRDRFHEATQGA